MHNISPEYNIALMLFKYLQCLDLPTIPTHTRIMLNTYSVFYSRKALKGYQYRVSQQSSTSLDQPRNLWVYYQDFLIKWVQISCDMLFYSSNEVHPVGDPQFLLPLQETRHPYSTVTKITKLTIDALKSYGANA